MLSVCRLCLAKDANFVVFNRQVALRIMSCTGLDVEANDGLPQLICQDCRLRLEEFHYFRKRCHAADRRLRCAKRVECRGNDAMVTSELLVGDEEDAIHLQDVSLCTATACSESNAHWRQEAAKMIRTEIDTYKKELLGMCKQQVREEIEQQVRTEVGELLLTQARKECRLNVLDSLFYEIESFFVRKRNAVVCEQAYGSEGFISDSENADLESVATTLCEENPSNFGMDVSTVDLLSDGENAAQAATPRNIGLIKREPKTPQRPIEPVAMVEINMQNLQANMLQDQDPQSSTTVAKKRAVASKPSKSKLSFKSPATTPINKSKQKCRRHVIRSPSGRFAKLAKDDGECYRCRLRSPARLNETT
ncbi:uncharacterized protein LOC117575997 [Drosophila albomicans]|uniref:Uncharacterized protein LOC117575997 n=1 Tax=Drosophila albomicans TaxID=7291 RepID=A0A6P8XIQ4_DROAB|nr:uncharacterized protein LOC117575997 [Drosophila albomicans]